MKRFYSDKWFWLALLLGAMVLGRALTFALAQSVGEWRPPTGPPPGGQSAAPVDTSSVDQLKSGNLAIGPAESRSNANLEHLGEAVVILKDSRQIQFRGDGETAAIGMFNGKLMAHHSRERWFEIGVGGSGDGVWKSIAGGVIYNDGKVGVGLKTGDAPRSLLSVGGHGTPDAAVYGESSPNSRDAVGVVGQSLLGIGVYGYGGAYNFYGANPNAKIYLAGRLGIGEENPKETLDVRGNALFGGDILFWRQGVALPQEGKRGSLKPIQFAFIEKGANGGYAEEPIKTPDYPGGFASPEWFCAAVGQAFYDGDIQEDGRGLIEMNLPCVRDGKWRASFDFRSHNTDERFFGTYMCVRKEIYNSNSGFAANAPKCGGPPVGGATFF